MRIPRFWAKASCQGGGHEGDDHRSVARGWSFSSLQEAKADAQARARHLCDLLSRGVKPDQYEYHDRPIREEIVEEIHEGDTQIALLTRNRYGALVLNSSSVLFVDVDFPKVQRSGLIESLLLAFNRKLREAKRQAVIQMTLQEIKHWRACNPSRSFRQYRTAEGLRLLFTDKLYDPTSRETALLLRELNADPLYVQLTEKQACFRARLSAKPWRCGSPRPPHSYPWSDAEAEREYRQWESEYARQDEKYRVCQLIEHMGESADEAALRTIVALHDRISGVESEAPLA